MFRFELNSVLSLKEKVEDAKKRELGIANTRKEELEFQKRALEDEHDVLHEEIRSNSYEMDIQKVKILNRYASYVNTQIKKTEVHIHNAQKVIDIKREELLCAMKERKILDNLKELKLEQYTEESKKMEQLFVDEVVCYQYSKAGGGENLNG